MSFLFDPNTGLTHQDICDCESCGQIASESCGMYEECKCNQDHVLCLECLDLIHGESIDVCVLDFNK